MRRATYVYVIGDDELHLGVFDISSDRPGHLQRVLQGELPDGHGALEGEAGPRGAHPAALRGQSVWRAPSGSVRDRDRAATAVSSAPWGLTAGWPASRARSASSPSTRCYAEHVAELNVEGAATMGTASGCCSAQLEVGSNLVRALLGEVMRSLRDDLTIDAHELEGVRSYDLGEIEGVELTFSDATPIAEQLIVFTASAEAEDGTICGSVVGTLDTAAASAGCARSTGAEGRGRARRDRHGRARLHLRMRPG